MGGYHDYMRGDGVVHIINQQKSWKYDVKLHHRATETIFELIYLGRQILILKPTVVVDGNLRTD